MFHRRLFLVSGAAALGVPLSGCGGLPALPGLLGEAEPAPRRPATRTLAKPDYANVYGEFPGEPFPIPPAPWRDIDPRFLRQTVEYPWNEPPGSIVVDPAGYHLFFVESPRVATRYGVGVGREGFGWSGQARVNMKRNWPDWVPPAEMVARSPEIRADLEQTPRGLGVRGGLRSPLGARALYLFGEGRDLGYRIHGTTEPTTVGQNVSSGCVRMINQDIVHLFTRASVGTPVTVLA